MCEAAFAAVPCGAGGQRLRTLPGVNPENGGWVRPLLKHKVPGGREISSCSFAGCWHLIFWGGEQLASIPGGHQ